MLEFYIREVKYLLLQIVFKIAVFFNVSVLAYTYYTYKDIDIKLMLSSAQQLASNPYFIIAFLSTIINYQTYKLLKTYKFRQLPYTFQFLNRTNESAKKIYDSYKKKKNGFHIYKNSSHRIDFKHYESEYENIKYFFKAEEIVIKRFKDGSVGIKIGERLPRIVDFSRDKIRENYLYFGLGEEQDVYASIDSMKHTLIASETGGGKSNAMSVLMISMIQGLLNGSIEKLIMVDLKGNELAIFKPLKELFRERIVFAYTMEEVKKLLKECEKSYQERKIRLDNEALSDIYELNIQEKKCIYGNIIFYIDELAQMTLKDENLFKSDKAYKETYLEVQKYMNRFLSLYRAMGMKMFLSTQSPRSEVITGLMKSNIPNKLMLRVNSKLNASVIMDTAIYEELEPINPTKFPSGRGILSVEGLNDNQPLLIQVPFIKKSEIKEYIKILTHKENR